MAKRSGRLLGFTFGDVNGGRERLTGGVVRRRLGLDVDGGQEDEAEGSQKRRRMLAGHCGWIVHCWFRRANWSLRGRSRILFMAAATQLDAGHANGIHKLRQDWGQATTGAEVNSVLPLRQVPSNDPAAQRDVTDSRLAHVWTGRYNRGVASAQLFVRLEPLNRSHPHCIRIPATCWTGWHSPPWPSSPSSSPPERKLPPTSANCRPSSTSSATPDASPNPFHRLPAPENAPATSRYSKHIKQSNIWRKKNQKYLYHIILYIRIRVEILISRWLIPNEGIPSYLATSLPSVHCQLGFGTG